MKELSIHNGIVLVDDEDAEMVSSSRWEARQNWHTYYAEGKKDRKTIFLHRVLLGLGRGIMVDHIDGNGLNNQRANLRVCTASQNQMNRHTINGVSCYKGVTWHKQRGRWQAQIKLNGKNKYLGLFDSEEMAAQAYDAAALRLFGQFAFINFSSKIA